MFHLPSSTGSAGAWEARWVVATTDYDSGGGTTGVKKGSGAVKREKSESVAAPAAAARKDKGKGKEKALFNPPATPAPQQQDDEDDLYGRGGDLGGFDDGGAGFEDEEAAWAEIDRLSQMATQQQQERRAPGTKDASAALQEGGDPEEWEFEGMEAGQALAPDTAEGTQLSPTQKGGRGKVGGWRGGGEEAAEGDERAAKKVRLAMRFRCPFLALFRSLTLLLW